jgi:hypothetical protein
MVDGIYFENTRIAHRAVFLPKNISYDRLSRALKKGFPELEGIRIERVTRRYELSAPLEPDSDCADLLPLRVKKAPAKERKTGEPLLRYPPGESPIERGLSRCY